MSTCALNVIVLLDCKEILPKEHLSNKLLQQPINLHLISLTILFYLENSWIEGRKPKTSEKDSGDSHEDLQSRKGPEALPVGDED